MGIVIGPQPLSDNAHVLFAWQVVFRELGYVPLLSLHRPSTKVPLDMVQHAIRYFYGEIDVTNLY